MEIEWGPEIAVDGERPEWLGDVDVGHTVTICGLETQYPWNTGDSEHITDMGEWVWPDIDAIRLPASHPAYIAIAKGFTPWSGGDEAPGDWDGGWVLWRDGTTHQCPSWNWKVGQDRPEEGPKPSDIIGYRRKAVPHRETAENCPEALPPISPQSIGSAAIAELSIKVDTTELKAAIAATASYTVTRDGLTITGPDLAHILRSIREDGNDPA